MSAKEILPKEHGTWAMVLIPWVVGCGVAGRVGAAELLLLLAILAFFFAETQAMNRVRLGFAARPDGAALARTRALLALFAGFGAAVGLTLVAVYRLVALVPLGLLAALMTAVSLLLVQRRLDRGPAGQTLAAIGLSLSAPLAYYVSRASLDAVAGELWLVNVLFFLAAGVYVRLKIAALKHRGVLETLSARVTLASSTLALQAVLLGVLALTLALGPLSPRVALAFVPLAIQVAIGVIRLDRPLRLKRLGYISVAQSLAFATLVITLADR